MVQRVAVTSLALLLGSCMAPLYEHATIKRGLAVTGGVSAGASQVMYASGAGMRSMSDYVPARALIAVGMLRAEFGIGHPDSSGNVWNALLVQACYGTGKWLARDAPDARPEVYDVAIGGKAYVGPNMALKMTAGATSGLDLTLIRDFGDYATGTAGLGFGGPTASLTGHALFPGNTAARASLSVNFIPFWRTGAWPSVQAGIGMEVW